MRLLTRHDKDDGGGGEGSHGGDLVTRDLLGRCCCGGAVAVLTVRDEKEREFGLGSPSACENRLGVADLNMPPLSNSGFSPPPRTAAPHLHNYLPVHPGTALDLSLRAPVPAPTPPMEYRSVCTLEKVRSALERAQREPALRIPLPPSSAAHASSASSSTTTSSAKRLREAAQDEEGERESKSPSSSSSSSVVVQGGEDRSAVAGMAAAGCPSCLLYVLISRWDPRCPRCNATVPLPPPPGKRPRIDLNVATSSTAQEPAAAANPLRTVNFL